MVRKTEAGARDLKAPERGKDGMKHLLRFILTTTPYLTYAQENQGTVCFGKNMAKPASEHSNRLWLSIGNSGHLQFNKKAKRPFIATEKLNTDKTYSVKVYFDGKVVRSWPLNFKELGANTALIWRAAGAWRMEAFNKSKCEQTQ